MDVNFNNKTFHLIENSENGRVNSQTVFKYKQEGDLITADYFGGTIRYGKIIAQKKGDRLQMVYQCLTTDNELKSGKATANIEMNSQHKIKLKLQWEWLDDPNHKGVSEYIEE